MQGTKRIILIITGGKGILSEAERLGRVLTVLSQGRHHLESHGVHSYEQFKECKHGGYSFGLKKDREYHS